MKILVYGAGNIGCLYAALLKESGQAVTVLARGERLSELQSHGIRLEHALTGQRTISFVETVETLDADQHYDLVLVVLPKDRLAEVIPILAGHDQTPNVMFFGNNAAGFDEITEALGASRVLLGFPGAAGLSEDGTIRYLLTSRQEQPTTIGELDGANTVRIKEIAEVLERAGFPVEICPQMDPWLKTHVAKISPTANALYAAGCDLERLTRTQDALVLLVRGIREGYDVLDALEIPITPAANQVVRWLPEPLLVQLFKYFFGSNSAVIKVGHAERARDEMKTITEEFRKLTEEASISTPALDQLRTYMDPSTEPLADGSAELSLNWSSVWALVVVLTVVCWWLLRVL